MRTTLAIICLLVIAASTTSLYADTVVLKTGEALEGTILKNNDAGIVLQVIYGTLLIPKNKILRLETDTPEMLVAREQKEAEARELAEKMRAEGKVLYKGKWVTEAEKAADEAKLAEDKKKRDEARAAEAAKKKAAEEALKAAALAQAQQLQQQQQQKQQQKQNNHGVLFQAVKPYTLSQ